MSAPAQRAPSAADTLAFLPVRVARAALTAGSLDAARSIGASVGRFAAGLGGSITDTARINLSLAFPEASPDEREAILFDSYANLGRGVAELALLQGPAREELLESVRVEGEEHALAARAASPTGGLLVVTAHYGTWDLYAAALSRRGHPLTVVHRGFGNPHIESMMTRVRVEGGGDLEELRMGRSAAPGLLSALRRGRSCILLVDQNARADEGVFVPFFSRLACTRSAPVVIAMRRGIPIIPAFGSRDPDRPDRHVVRVEPPLALEPPDPGCADTQADPALMTNVGRMNAAVEAAIRRSPTSWLWSQRRFRTRPSGDAPDEERAPVYPDRRGPLRSVRRWFRARRA